MTYTVRSIHHEISFESNSYLYFWPYSRKGVVKFCDRISDCIYEVIPKAFTSKKIKIRFTNENCDHYTNENEAVISMQYSSHWHDVIMHELLHCTLERANMTNTHAEMMRKWFPLIQKEYRHKYGWLSFMMTFGAQYY